MDKYSTVGIVFTIIAFLFRANGEIVKIGNELKESTSGPDQSGTTFLLYDKPIQEAGLVFGFAAYIRKQTPVTFQIWRPAPAVSENSFSLVNQWQFDPVKTEGLELFYIHNLPGTNCEVMQAGDRLAVYFPQAPGSVAYTFSSMDKTYQSNQANGTKEGATVTFDTLTFPYKFSVALYLDTDQTSSSVCPTSSVIPEDTDGSNGGNPPDNTNNGGSVGATGEMGATGATGLRGATGPHGPSGERGATGSTGPIGPMGPEGPRGYSGSTGPAGPSGPRGMQGEKGSTGERGPQGEQGPPGPVGSADTPSFDKIVEESYCSWCPTFLDPYLILALLIWLIVVSLLLVGFMIYYCCNRQPAMRYENGVNREDLWKKYDNAGFENGEEPTYSAISEGKTAF